MPMLSDHQPSLNQLWASLLLEELCRHGVTHLCLAPGSRSTPLVMAADALAHPPSDQACTKTRLQLHHHFDERGLGFLALGIAKASHQPVAIITTSGTAVANLYSAVIEAAQTNTPLIIISADRPPRLHGCGANQAIEQHQIFASYPRHSLYLPPPQIDYPAAQLLQQISTALCTIESEVSPGVCHINCMYDEPLYPDSINLDVSAYLEPISQWRNSDKPFVSAEPQRHSSAPVPPNTEQWRAFSGQAGIIVVGALPNRSTATAVKALARQLGWPLLVDIQSQLKTDPDCLGLTDHLLSDPLSRRQLDQADHLLQFGSRLVSKRLQDWIEQHPWQQFWLVHPGDRPLAPGRNHSSFFASEVGHWCQLAIPALCSVTPYKNSDRQTTLQQQNRVRQQALKQQFSVDAGLAPSTNAVASAVEAPALTELSAAYQLLKLAPSKSWLLAGNSLSIRLLDLVAGSGATSSRPLIFANRGASGIDGLVSTALGIGLGAAQLGTLLLGDYSLLYDLNALALIRNHPQPLIIVVLNNDGGGIFRMLPVADEAIRQEHYQRPHGLTFDDACRMFAIDYYQPRTLSQFIDHYQNALSTQNSCLIEVCTDARTTEQQIRALTTTDSSS